MVYAIITAAGKGIRANLGLPKQFYEVNGKPLIWYTLKVFNECPLIDEIVLVLDGEHLLTANDFFSSFSFNKLKYFVCGGETNQLSIHNALSHLKQFAKADDIILIHDGVRCLINNEIIANNIKVCKEKGNAITAIPCNEAMLISDNGISSNKSIDRNLIYKTQTPHSMRYGKMLAVFDKALLKGINNSVALCTLLIEQNEPVYFSKGSNENFKITNPEDIRLFTSFFINK